MSQPFVQQSYQQDIYSQALASIWNLYDKLPDISYANSKDIDIWEIVQRDPKIRQGIQQRLNRVAGPTWGIFAGDDKREDSKRLASVVEDSFHRIPHFRDIRRRLASSVFRGMSVEFMQGKRREIQLGSYPPLNWWCITKMTNVDPRRFVIRPVKEQRIDGTTRVRGELNISVLLDENLKHVKTSLYRYVKVEHPEWFVRVIYEDEESRLGQGRGLLESIYFYHWVKQIVIREGLQGLERWSQGIIVGKMDENREASTSKTNEDLRDEMVDVLNKMRSRHVVVVGKEDEVEVLTGGGEGHQIVTSFLNYVDNSLMALCTGAILPSGGAQESGSLARAEVEQDTQESIVQYDRDKIDEDLTTDMIGLFLRVNQPQLAATGLLAAAMETPPKFKTVQEKMEDPDKAVDRVVKLHNAGIPLSEEEVYQKIGFSPIKPGERTLASIAAPKLPPMIPNAPFGR